VNTVQAPASSCVICCHEREHYVAGEILGTVIAWN
jgi:hypothetical protein